MEVRRLGGSANVPALSVKVMSALLAPAIVVLVRSYVSVTWALGNVSAGFAPPPKISFANRGPVVPPIVCDHEGAAETAATRAAHMIEKSPLRIGLLLSSSKVRPSNLLGSIGCLVIAPSPSPRSFFLMSCCRLYAISSFRASPFATVDENFSTGDRHRSCRGVSSRSFSTAQPSTIELRRPRPSHPHFSSSCTRRARAETAVRTERTRFRQGTNGSPALFRSRSVGADSARRAGRVHSE